MIEGPWIKEIAKWIHRTPVFSQRISQKTIHANSKDGAWIVSSRLTRHHRPRGRIAVLKGFPRCRRGREGVRWGGVAGVGARPVHAGSQFKNRFDVWISRQFCRDGQFHTSERGSLPVPLPSPPRGEGGGGGSSADQNGASDPL